MSITLDRGYLKGFVEQKDIEKILQKECIDENNIYNAGYECDDA